MFRMLKVLTVLVVLLSVFCLVCALAENDSQVLYNIRTSLPDSGTVDTVTLDQYVDHLFGIGESIPVIKLRGTNPQFSEDGTFFYGFLSQCISEVASGQRSSTVFTVEHAFTLESEEAERLILALKVNHPFELYWFDSIQGVEITCIGDETVFSFSVVSAYAAGSYMVETSYASAAVSAVARADAIIEAYAQVSDEEKLRGYKNEICQLVSYNTTAAEYSENADGNAWQLVWVFDEDDSTNVVCEGYAKAFQYLCDHTVFSDSQIRCYCVSGTMDGEAHMWNLVRMGDSKVYLVDVTNCDSDTVGESDLLFLAGYSSGDAVSGYTFLCNGTPIQYVYDDGMFILYSVEELTVADGAGGSANIFIAEDVIIPEGVTNFALCELLAPVGREALLSGYTEFAFPLDESRMEEIVNLLFCEIRGVHTDLLFDLRMQEYSDTAFLFGGLQGTYAYRNGYLFIPMYTYEDSHQGQFVELWSDEAHLGDYPSVASALQAAADANYADVILHPSGNGFLCLPRQSTGGINSLTLAADSPIQVVTLGNLTLPYDLTLENCSFAQITATCISIGSHTLTLREIVDLGIMNFSMTNTNTVGSDRAFSIVGGENSCVILEPSSQCDCYGSLTVEQLDLRSDAFFNVRGSQSLFKVQKLIVSSTITLGVGVNESADSVYADIKQITIEDDACLIIDCPSRNQSLTIHSVDETQGWLILSSSTLSDMPNWEYSFSVSDITILGDYLPADSLHYQYDGSADVPIEEFCNYIPSGFRLLKAPNLDPSTLEVLLDVSLWNEDDWGDAIYKQFSFSVSKDSEGYLTRGAEMTKTWIGPYLVVLNLDRTYSIMEMKNDPITNPVYPTEINGVRVTGIGSEHPFQRKYLLNPSRLKIASYTSGTAIIPAFYTAIRGFTFNWLDAVIFLGPKPVFDDATNDYSTDRTTVYYLPAYADSWAPNGETMWNNMLLRPYESSKVLQLPASVTEIDDEAFAGTGFEIIIIPEGCQRIGSRAFADCDYLLYVSIPASVTEIAEDAFAGCDRYKPVFSTDQ